MISWKLVYLISHLRTGFPQKLLRLKTCPQGAVQAQEEKFGFLIITTSNFTSLYEKWPLKSYKLIFTIEYQWPQYIKPAVHMVELYVLVIITPFLFCNWIDWQKMLCKYVVTQSICTHYSCFENMGRLVTLKKIR